MACLSQLCQRALEENRSLLDVQSVVRWVQSWTVWSQLKLPDLAKSQHFIPPKKLWSMLGTLRSGPSFHPQDQRIMNSERYCKTLEHNLKPWVVKLKLDWKWIMQHDRDLKHSSKTAEEWLRKMKICILDWTKVCKWIQLKSWGGTWSGQFMSDVHPTSWQKSLTADVRDWLVTTETAWLRLLLLKEAQYHFNCISHFL